MNLQRKVTLDFRNRRKVVLALFSIMSAVIIWGANDSVPPPAVADDFNKLLHKSELFWIKKCGNAPMMEHPSMFNSILKDWLKRKKL